MKKLTARVTYHFFIYLLIISLMLSCSAPRYVNVPDVDENSAVRIYMVDDKIYEGLITQRSGAEIILVSEVDHHPHALQVNDIRRVEKLDKNYDFLAYPISDAEINKYKSSRNSWGYAIGGAVLGGLAGIIIALPFWYADAGIPPYFTGGIGAVGGSIFFGLRGVEKDREVAVETVRYIRQRERELEKQKAEEERQLEEIRQQRDELKKKLDEQKPKSD